MTYHSHTHTLHLMSRYVQNQARRREGRVASRVYPFHSVQLPDMLTHCSAWAHVSPISTQQDQRSGVMEEVGFGPAGDRDKEGAEMIPSLGGGPWFGPLVQGNRKEGTQFWRRRGHCIVERALDTESESWERVSW